MRILLTGIGGQLGGELQQILAPLGEVTGVDRQSLDLAQPTQIRQVIGEVKPDLIVNAAAYTAVDKAETETELANAINGNAPTIMAQEAQKLGAAIIHISTDYVFDGQKNTPYKEDDTPNPINAYGRSKLLGEEGVKSNCDRYIILRTAWVYGSYGKGNFVKTMLRLGGEREELRVVVDQVGTPTWTGDIAQTIFQLIELTSPPTPLLTGEGSSTPPFPLDEGEGGEGSSPTPPFPTREGGLGGLGDCIYHFTNSGVISWYDFAVSIFEEAEELGFPLKVKRVIPITTSEYPTPAARPTYSVLSNQKISTVLGSHPPYWRKQLRKMIEQLYSELVMGN